MYIFKYFREKKIFLWTFLVDFEISKKTHDSNKEFRDSKNIRQKIKIEKQKFSLFYLFQKRDQESLSKYLKYHNFSEKVVFSMAPFKQNSFSAIFCFLL